MNRPESLLMQFWDAIKLGQLDNW